MLGIGKLAAGAEDYYLAITQGIEDYYVGVEAPGQWIGSSQRLLGLAGEVHADDLRAVFDGYDPVSGTALSTAANRRVVAFDLSYKADKTVSLLHAWGGSDVSERVEAAHSKAVASSITYLEDVAVFTRRGRNGVEQVEGDGLIAACFRHFRNRNDDPHLHDHVLVPNMVRAADGRWSTIDARHLYTHAKTAGYVYQAVLRHELSVNLGIEFGPVTNGVAPIAGIPRPIVDAFSTRRAEIVEHLEALGASPARAAQIATLQTRRAKDAEPDVAAIQAEWTTRARAHGYEPASVVDVVGPGRFVDFSREQRAQAVADMLGPTGLTEQASTFAERDVIRAWCEQMPQGAPLSELRLFSAQTIGRDEVVTLDDGRHTTAELLALEQRVIDRALAGSGRHVAVASSQSLAAAFANRPTISQEQADLARQLTVGGDPVSVIVAAAGTGKGFVLGVAREAWEASGHRVYGAALAARAAGELQTGAGIESTTIARTLQQIDNGHPMQRDDVLVIDEAGMVGTRQLARLMDHASVVGAKVVLVGDPRQLPEIDAGGLLGGLARRMPVLSLHENRRQVEAWEQAALGQLRSGSVDQALEQYDLHGRIHWSPRLDTVQSSIVDAWAEARSRGEDAIILAARREDVRALNNLARPSTAVALDGPALKVGGESFQAGDQVMTLRNDRRLDVRNGDRGQVLAVDTETRSLSVRFRDHVKELPAEYLEAGHLTHGYAMTVHKAQGLTCDRAFVLGTDDLYREMGYVAMSRGRLGNHLYAVGERRMEIEPTHAPTVAEASDDLLVAALRTSKAQTMASERATVVNPLVAISDADLGRERRQLVSLTRAMPADVSRQIEGCEASIAEHRATIDRLLEQREAALTQRRPLHDVVKGNDLRTRVIDRQIASEHGWLDRTTEKLDELRNHQHRRRVALEAVEGSRPRLAELGAEIERRVSLRVADALGSPAEYLTKRLGPIPEAGDGREAWITSAQTIERFRLTNGVTDARHALGGHEVDHTEQRAAENQLQSLAHQIDPEHHQRGMRMRR